MSATRFDDDEQPISPTSNAGKPALGFTDVGKASVKADYVKEAPLEAGTIVRVLLDVSSASTAEGRKALDLVVVLDVSGSMGDDGKLDKLKSAMQFVIRKLSPMDRLSIVSFNNSAAKLCALRSMTETAQNDLKGIVNGLAHGGGTNIKAGLETGLNIISSRKFNADRTANILLMSDGQQNDGDARQVANPGNVPVYTLGFGKGTDYGLMKDLAKNGGTFNAVPDKGDMTAVFSQLVAGFLTVVVQDLQLTLSKPNDENDLDQIVSVAPGDYVTEPNPPSTKVVVKFGDLFSGEVRKVVVDLSLIAAFDDSEYEASVLEIEVSYSNSRPIRGETLQVKRTQTATGGAMTRKLQTELARRQHAASITKARTLADEKNLDEAKEKLVEAQNALEDILDQANPMVGMLRTELEHLMDFMESQELYEAEGRPYALASESSHARQRFAARGDVESVRLFATPRMDAYLEQAKEFTKDPNAPLPNAEEDTKEEVKKNPMAAIVGPLSFYIQSAVQALQAIDKIITATANNA